MLAGLLATLAGCGRKQPVISQEGIAVAGSHTPATPPTAPPRTGESSDAGPRMIVCPRCGQPHKYGEPGKSWPDAVFALSLSDAEKEAIHQPEDEDVAVIRDTHFVHGVVLVPVKGWPEPFAIGLWIRISSEDFRDFESRKRVNHPSYQGHIANQDNFLGPTLGRRARMSFLGVGQRPALTLLDGSPLAKAQVEGVSEDLGREWIAKSIHRGEPDPPERPKTLDLEKDGYRLMKATDVGRSAASLPRSPKVMDEVKVAVQFIASDEKGDPAPIVAAWWLKLDDVSSKDTWSGTLANYPIVPAALWFGKRFWMGPEHVIEFRAAPH